MINYAEKGIELVELLASHGVEVVNGKVTHSPLTDAETQRIIDDFDPLPISRAKAIQRINDQAQAFMSEIEGEYPEFEKKTFTIQKLEVEAWQQDNNAPTPTIDIFAESRGMDRVEFIARTIAKVQFVNPLAAKVGGVRQKLKDDIKASEDLNFINSVNFELPNG